MVWSHIGSSTAPPQNYITANKECLLEECRFFGVDCMIARIQGRTSIFDLNLEDRRIKLKECDVRDSLHQKGLDFLLEVLSQESSPLDEAGLGLPLFRRGCRTRPTMKCNSYEDFSTRFNRLTGGLVQEIADVPGIVFAGGSVIGTLTRGAIGDVDIFLTCPLEQA